MPRNLTPLSSAAEFVRRRAFLICIYACTLFTLSAGCAPREEIVRQPEIEPYRGTVTVEVLKRSVGFGAVGTLKALTEVKVFSKGEPAGSFSGVLGYKAPDALKTVFFGPFGLTVMEMLISHELLQVYLPPKNALYEMKSPEVAFSSLMNNDRYLLAMQEEGDLYALYAYDRTDTSQGPVMKYLFDRTYLLNRRVILYRAAGGTVVAAFGNFNGRVPEQIRLAFSNGTDMEITLQEPEFDTEIPDEYFAEIEHGDKKVLPLQELLKRVASPGN
jgi:hypothetical protein